MLETSAQPNTPVYGPSWWLKDQPLGPNPIQRPRRAVNGKIATLPENPTWFQQLDAVPLSGAEWIWAKGRTIAKYEKREPELEQDWADADLDTLIATQPDCSNHEPDELVETHDALIAAEAAKFGISVGSTSSIENDDTDDEDETGWIRRVPYATIDRLTQYRIDRERRTKMSGPLRRLFPARDQQGRPFVAAFGYGRLSIEQQARLTAAYAKAHERLFGTQPNPDARTTVAGQTPLSLARTAPDPEYTFVDADPYRYELAAEDPDTHTLVPTWMADDGVPAALGYDDSLEAFEPDPDPNWNQL